MKEQELLDNLRNIETRNRAFSELVNQYSEKLYWTVRHIVGTHDDTDDVIQNTFIKAWNKLDSFRGDSQLSTWLHRIAINEALDFIRRKKKYMEADIELGKVNAFTDEYFDGNKVDRLLRTAMETLPEAQRTVFSLKYFENMQYKEISEILGTSEGGLKANYHYAVDKIKKFLERTL